MLIGISGKIQSGKDTIGLIIQYLTDETFNTLTFNEYLEEIKFETPPHSRWKIKKYADNLKLVISILTGCTREQLESDEFKTSKLSDEWIRYGYADGFIKTYIGNGEMSGAIMNNKQCSKEEYEEHYKTNWQTAYKSHLTYRDLLQYLGTDLLRNQLNENCWINSLFSKYKLKIGKFDNVAIQDSYPNWIITDCRFPNETTAVKDRGGFVIRVNRFNSNQQLFDQHPSETALDDYPFDYVINNNGTIKELIEQVKVILIKEQIL